MFNRICNRRLLLIEDDGNITEEIIAHFKKFGNAVFCATTKAEAADILSKEKFDAIILDIFLPDGNGMDILSDMPDLPPVIIMSTLGDEETMLTGFKAGAIDYVVKPCSPELLEAHISLRISHGKEAKIMLSGITLDVSERTVFYKNKPVPLTSSEFNILYFLMSNPDKFFNSSEIYSQVWRAPSLQTTTIRYHISNLRRKIKEIAKKNLIITDFGKGYAFTVRNN